MGNYDSKTGERVAGYKKDSTQGRSRIDPLNYKGDVLTQAYVDSRVLATLCLWLERTGLIPRSLSDVARRPLELLFEHLVETDSIEPIDDTAQARELLQSRFRVGLNRGGRGLKNVMHNTVLSSMRQGLGEKTLAGQRFNDAQRPDISTVRRQIEVERLVKIAESMPAQTVEQAIEAARASGAIASEATVKEGMTMEEVEEHIKEADKEAVAKENDPETLAFLKSHTVKDE